MARKVLVDYSGTLVLRFSWHNSSAIFWEHAGTGRASKEHFFTSSFQHWNVINQGFPYGRQVNRPVGMDIEVSGILDDTPRNRRIECFCIVGQFAYQFTDLHNAHTTGILKHDVIEERFIIIIVTLQIVVDALVISDNLFKQFSVTDLDKATPRLFLCLLEKRYQSIVL